MIPFQQFEKTPIVSSAPEVLGTTEKLLLKATSLFPGKQISLKLNFYSQFLYFLEIVGLYLIAKNQLTDQLHTGMPATSSDRLQNSLLQMLFHYQIISKKVTQYIFSEKCNSLTSADFQFILNLVENQSKPSDVEPPVTLKKECSAFRLILELISFYRNRDYAFIKTQHATQWKQLISSKQLDYEIRLSETLLQLTRLELPHKIRSPFEENYYTESGRNAFLNFTRDQFLSCISEINQHHPVQQVLDIGCGYGDYIEAIHSQLPHTKITGIELQEKVFAETHKRFSGNNNIELLNQNIFDFTTNKKVDLVLLNYVLFYFSNEQKEKLFGQLHQQLQDNGSILICQYYARLEPLKKQLAKHQKQQSVKFRIGNYFGDKILYANALWNEASDTFVQSEIWTEFVATLHKTGFEVAALTHADPFYYSLFVEVKKIN